LVNEGHLHHSDDGMNDIALKMIILVSVYLQISSQA